MMDRLRALRERFEELERLMADPEVVSDLAQLQRYAREHAELRDIVALYDALQETEANIADARSWLENGHDEPELQELARETLSELEPLREEQLEALRRKLVPTDPNDAKNVILEVRGAAGGEEANLFAAELFRMYNLYAEEHRWRVEVLDLNETGIGGIKEVVAKIEGNGVFGRLKFESGVHRVQRVPSTESSGRIHTSTAGVMVLPEAEEFDVDIRPDDLRIDVYRSSGKGGQGVNTTDSAVRITHLPTGLVVTCQNERSQLQNKASALAVLRSKLYDIELERRARELGETRKSQVQTGDRSEKIRTYNFPQDRVTDHRINLTLHNLPSIMNGRIDPFIDELIARSESDSLDADAE